MKRDLVRKLCAAALAGIMVIGSASAVLADGGLNGDGSTALTKIPFKVNFTAEGLDNLPGTSFSYTIAPVGQDDITDEGVTEGPGGGVTFEGGAAEYTASFTAGAASPQEASVNLVFDTEKLEASKTYRYSLTQAGMTAAQVKSGILNEAGTKAADVRNLDIYTNGSGDVVYAVLYKSGGTRTPSETAIAYSDKDDSFGNTFGKEGTTPVDPDNPDNPDDPTVTKDKGVKTVTLKKTTSGNSASADDAFPFTVTFSDPAADDGVNMTGVAYKVEFDADGKATYGGTDTPSYLIGSPVNFSFKSGGTATFTVPNNVNVKVEETTDTALGYTITVTENSFADASTLPLEASTVEGTVSGSDASITFNNHRGVASPTGIALRYAPYGLLAAFAVVLLLAFRRRNPDGGSDMI